MSNYQLPEGYKQTEVGVIPEDWELKTIGDIGSVSSGGTPSRTILSYWNGTIPWVTTTQIDFKTINSAEQFITKDGLNSSAANLFPPGTLLMAMYGQGKTRGKVAILGVKASTNQACAAILLGEKIDRNYVFHYLVSHYEVIRTLSNTGNQENLNGLIIKSIKIPLPSLPEQRAIAQALSDVDALIAALDKLIAKKRDLKIATMQQLLTGKKRLPGFDYVWEKYQLGDVIEKIIGGGTPSRSNPDFWDGEIPWVTVKDFTTFDPFDTQEYITKEGLSKSASNLISKGTLIISTRMALGKTVIYEVDVAINQDLKALFPYADIDNIYLYFWFQNHAEYIEKLGSGSTVKGISLIDLKSISFLKPSLKAQRAIATVLSDMDTEITALESRLVKTQAIKQGMMQELLTGRTRLV